MADEKSSFLFPLLAVGGLGAVAYFAFPDFWSRLFGGGEEGDLRGGAVPEDTRRTRQSYWDYDGRVRILPDYPGGYGDLYKGVFQERPPVKKLPVVDLSDLIDARGIDDNDDAYIITDKDFKLFDINRPDLPGYRRRIREPMLSKVIYGDKGDRPQIIPYYDGYSYYVGGNPDRQPELGRLTNEQQSNSNDRRNSLNLYV